MPTPTKTSLLTAAAVVALSGLARADYPVASHRYLADPSTLVTADRVYVYCSNDDESPVEGSYNIPNVVCLSTSDMKNWTDHGIVFDASRDTTWAKKTWAPAAIERDGKFFLYFGNGGANIGVAVGESPVGPFKDVLGRDLVNHDTPGVKPAKNMWLFDPGVFIDDDGQAYMYFGGNGDDNPRVAKLKRDMISLDGDVIKMSVPNFFEAAWVFKRNGIYYYSYSATPKAEMRIDYMTSDHPTQGFKYRGAIGSQPPINHNNNHAAEFLFKGEWYHVYHNRIVARTAGIPAGFRRNIGIERMFYNDDGSIKEIVYTSDSMPQVGYLDPYQRVEGETFAREHGVETEPCAQGGMNLTALEAGDWVLLRGVDFRPKGATRFIANVAAGTEGSAIEVRVGGPDGFLLGTCPVGKTADGAAWTTVSGELKDAVGVQDVCLRFVGGAGSVLKLDHWKVE